MKKIIISMIGMVAFSALQAYTVDWKIATKGSSVYAYTGTDNNATYFQGNVYLYAFDTALGGKTFTGVDFDFDTLALSGANYVDTSSVGASATNGRFSGSMTSSLSEGTYNFYYVLAQTNANGDEVAYYISGPTDLVSISDPSSSSSASFNFSKDSSVNTQYAGSWNVKGGSEGVPEPTSALLALLGLAGLAMKRKVF